MRGFLAGLLIGLLIGLAVPAGADIIGAGWRSVNDGAQVYEPALPKGYKSAISSITGLSGTESPATLVYVRPTDGTNPCEGKFLAIMAAGRRCIEGVEP